MVPTAQTALATLALVIMGILSVALVFHEVPQANQQLVTFALGAISGALTVGGGQKVAEKLSSTQSGDINVQPDAPVSANGAGPAP